MPNYTPELNLKKPLGTEFISITDLNDNFDIMDNAVTKIKVNGTYAGKASGEVDLGTVVAETVEAVAALPAAGDSTKLYSNAGKVWWWDGTQWVDVTATGGGGTITGIVSTTLDVTGTGTKAINLKATDQATLADVANKADADDVYTKTDADAKFVAQETGKGLSTNDYDAAAVAEVAKIADKADADDVYTKTDADALLDDKVDKETGKGLSTNDYDNDEKADVAAAFNDASCTLTKFTFTKNDGTTKEVTMQNASASGAGAMSATAYSDLQSAFKAAAYTAATATDNAKMTFTKVDGNTVDVDMGAAGAGIDTLTNTDGYVNPSVSGSTGTIDLKGDVVVKAETATATAQGQKLTFTPATGTAVTLDNIATATELGTLSSLTTTAKTSAVAAVNELDAEMGDDTLTTSATTVKAAINELDGAMDNAVVDGSYVAATRKLMLDQNDGTSEEIELPEATTTVAGLMSATDKTNLDASFSSVAIDATTGKVVFTPNSGTATELTLAKVDYVSGENATTQGTKITYTINGTTTTAADNLVNEHQLGLLSDLDTDETGTIVGAINEIVGDNYVKSLSFTAETTATPGVLTIGKKTGTDVTLNLEQYLKSVSGTASQIIVDTATDGTVIAPNLKLDDSILTQAAVSDGTAVTDGNNYQTFTITNIGGDDVELEDIVTIDVLGSVDDINGSGAITAYTIADLIGDLTSVNAQNLTGTAMAEDIVIADMFGDFSDDDTLVTKEVPLKHRQSVMKILADLRKLLDVEYKEASVAVTSGTQYTWTVSDLKWGDDTAYTADEVNFEVELGDTTNGMHIQQGIDSITFSGTTATILWTANQTGTYNVYGRVHKKLYKSGTIAG